MTQNSFIIHSCKLVTTKSIVDNAWVAVNNGVISKIGSGTNWVSDAHPTTKIYNAHNSYLAPGFIDIHCHGGGGHNYDEVTEQAFKIISETHQKYGTTRSLVSLVSDNASGLKHKINLAKNIIKNNNFFLGIHLEGPFISLEYCGAHSKHVLNEAAKENMLETIKKLNETSEGTLKMVTLAPELPKAYEAVTYLKNNNIIAAIGHTAADYEQSKKAFDLGASVLTHMFNAMPSIHHRAPGPIIAALENENVTLEIIHDGVHVNSKIIKQIFPLAKQKIALITDAMAASGFGDGEYLLGELEVSVKNNIARLKNGNSIAGSTLTLDKALKNSAQINIDIIDIVNSLTSIPAKTLGISNRLGQITVNYLADLVLFNNDFEISKVWREGKLISENTKY